MAEVQITDENFNEYFFDSRKHKPKKGQVLARYRAAADFVDSYYKQDIINLLKMDKVQAVVQLMQRVHSATPKDAVRVPLEMAEDMASGMSDEEVMEKPYRMIIELTFWCDKENIPMDDPHWECISLRELEDHILETEEGGWTIRARIVNPDGDEPENN